MLSCKLLSTAAAFVIRMMGSKSTMARLAKRTLYSSMEEAKRHCQAAEFLLLVYFLKRASHPTRQIKEDQAFLFLSFLFTS
jgi:hypothetical protein